MSLESHDPQGLESSTSDPQRGSSRRSDPLQEDAMLRELQLRPFEFDFHQAVRLMHLAAHRATGENAPRRRPVGDDYAAADEAVRFRVLPSLTFPGAEITSLQPGRVSVDADGETISAPEMTVTFMGLVGPQGVLPRHYTQMLIDAIRQKDLGFRDFLDIFHHRMISLFYRAWEKYHFPIAFESARLQQHDTEDLFTRGLHCLVGLGGTATRRQLNVPDMAFLYYGGLFAQRPPNAVSLERLTEDYFGVATEVVQFQGQWMYLDPADQTQMCLGDQPLGQNTELGVTALVGDRVWNIENRFAVRLGPLRYDEFARLAPFGSERAALDDLIRMYVGLEYDVDTQLVLRHDEVPCVQLSSDSETPPRLGWNTWIYNQAPARDADEATFHVTGVTA